MKKIPLLLVGIIMYIGLFTGVINALNQPASNLDYADFEWIEVEQGDSLWNIAKRYNKQRGISIHEMLEHIYLVNNLKSPLIHPGQKLKIPL